MRRLISLLSLLSLLALLVLTGCGDGPKPQDDVRERRAAAAADAEEQAASKLDRQLEQTNDALTAAARQGDRPDVQRLERELDRLARQDQADTGPPADSSSDPFERVLDRIAFKRSPLFVQQITSMGDDHELFVGVEQAVFCLRSEAERRRAAETVYLRQDSFLRARKIRDFHFIVVPVKSGRPSRRKALAIGSDGRLRLTSRGRRCSRRD